MIPGFNKLSETEKELMLKAPILACILIAGADGKIDQNEIKGAIHAAREKQKRSPPNLMEFYSMVAEDFEDKLKVFIQNYPASVTERNQMLEEELTQLNFILPRLDKIFAAEFYGSIKDIALAIAQSSGGVLGINKVGQEEARYVSLKMIKDPDALS